MSDTSSALRARSIPIPVHYDSLPLKLCISRRSLNSTIRLDMSMTNTLSDLKQKIASSMNLSKLPSYYFLEVFDSHAKIWKRVDVANDHAPLYHLPLYSNSVLSVGSQDRPSSSRPHSSHLASTRRDYLLFQLCTRPRDVTDSLTLDIPYTASIGKLRRKVYEMSNQTASRRPLFLLKDGLWTKFDANMDDRIIEDFNIPQYSFFSVDEEDPISAPKPLAGLCGLRNLGNTCYMNSVFQCLSNIPEFRKQVLALPDDIDAPIINQFRRLLRELWSSKNKTFDPRRLVENIQDNLSRYNNSRQHDAQEFMNYFLNVIHAELNGRTNLITDLFYGQSRSLIKCSECQQEKTTDEPMSFLPLSLSNYQRTALFVRTNGEYRVVSIQVDDSVRTVQNLIECFIAQHESTLDAEQLRAARVVDNVFKAQYKLDRYLKDVSDDELAILEGPKKSSDESYILCRFEVYEMNKPFRPPTVLAKPANSYRYANLSDQIEQLLGHLCSVTHAPRSDCRLYWTDSFNTRRELTPAEYLFNLDTIVIEIPLEYATVYETCHKSTEPADRSALASLIADYCREEPLEGTYRCSKCSKGTKARQRTSLRLPLPPVLIIQLKRFAFDSYFSEKINTFVSFPLKGLDLSDYVAKDTNGETANMGSTKYNLVAVSNHSGDIVSGHYTTYGKNSEDNQWYQFNDLDVTKVKDDKDVVKRSAYILVYVRAN